MTVPLSEIFDVSYGHSLELNRLRLLDFDKGGIAFVSRKMGDNGISAYVEPIENLPPSESGQLTCALGGNGVLSTFLQETPFYSGRDVSVLTPRRPEMKKSHMLFYCACLVANRYRFSYGRQANRSLRHLLVPSPESIPEYVGSTCTERFDGCDKVESEEAISLSSHRTWRYFKIGTLFQLKKGLRLTKANMVPGTLPYVGASDSSNGITAKIGQKAIHSGGTITVSYNGSVAEAFYQPEPYWATDDVNVLYPRSKLSAFSALFVCAVLKHEKYRYNYGRKWHLERMRESYIKLPSLPDDNPDWAYMEKFIKSLSFSSQVLP